MTPKYVVRSTKEESRLEAIETAYEFADNYRSKANQLAMKHGKPEYIRSKARSSLLHSFRTG